MSPVIYDCMTTMLSSEKSQGSGELSSIINVVQRDQSNRKLELKSVVQIGNDGTKNASSNGVKSSKSSSKSSKSVHEKPVLLLPFGHQVSGRASMLCYDETTILKPYVSRELFFYQSMPDDLKKLTPQFRGLVTVSFIEDSTTESILAYALPRTLVKPTSKSIIKLFAEEPKPHSKRCVKDFGKTHVIFPDSKDECNKSFNDDDLDKELFIESCGEFSPIISQVKTNDAGDDDDVVSELSQGFDVTVTIGDTKSSEKENVDKNFSSTGLHNPWNSKVLDDAWLKLKLSDTDDPSNGKKKRFTLLENVVARYRRPCVLDLKIGTRVRENASPEKIARHVTAINFGARLSGMQIYHPDQERFIYHNKYYGHNLTVSGFKSNLRHFFSRGRVPIKGSTKLEKGSLIDKTLAKQAIKKLSRLKDAVGSMESHRFYSSSILLLYEGDVGVEEEDEEDSDFKDEEMDSISGKISSTENSLETQDIALTNEKPTRNVRSFSFSEFLHRMKQSHSKHHAKRSHEYSLSKRHHDDPKKSSQRCLKGSVVYKHEKSQRRNHEAACEKTHKASHHCHHHHYHHHCCKDHRDFVDSHKASFASKSWPPRSKSSARKISQKTREIRPENTPMEISESDELPEIPSFTDSRQGGCLDERPLHARISRRHRDVIDLRMIDFAHYCFRDNSMHPGPDGGFLFGLENLIALLSEMLKS